MKQLCLLAAIFATLSSCSGKVSDADIATAISLTQELESSFATAVLAAHQANATSTPSVTPSPVPTPTVSFHGNSLIDYLMVDDHTTFNGYEFFGKGNRFWFDNWMTQIDLGRPFGITVNAESLTYSRAELILTGRFNEQGEPWWRGLRMYIQFAANQAPELNILYGGTSEKRDFFFSLWQLDQGEPFSLEFDDPCGKSFSVQTIDGEVLLHIDLAQLESELGPETLQLLSPILTPSTTLSPNVMPTVTPTLAPNATPQIELFPLSAGLFPEGKLWVGWGVTENGELLVREFSIHFRD